MKPRMGRPKSNNAKSTQLAVRLDDDLLKKLDEISQHYNETRVQALRHGIETLYSNLIK